MSSADLALPPGVNLSPTQVNELRRVFKKFDTNNNGLIERKELIKAMKQVSFRKRKAAAEEIMMNTDLDKDKSINFQEFVEAVIYTTNPSGASNGMMRSLVDAVAVTFVKPSDDESLDYLQSYGCWPPPVAILIFSIIEIGIFAHYANKECGPAVDLECPLSFSSTLAFRPGCRDQVWRYLTYVLVHAGIQHILFNVLIGLVVGLPLEMVHGSIRVSIVYWMGGLAGSLASSVFDPYSNLVGASAAVYALVGAHVADVFLNWAEMPFRWVRAGILFVLVGLDFSISIYTRYYSDEPQTVSYSGHLAGFMMGATLGTRVLKNLSGHQYETVVAWVGFGLAIVGCVFALFWNIFYTYGETAGCPYEP